MKKFLGIIIISSFLLAFDLTFTQAFNYFNQGINLINKNPQLAEKKFKKAYKLISKIENKKSSQIYYMLGRMYLNGWGVEQNYNLAQKYLLKALKLGNKRATCSLVKLYINTNKINLAKKYLKIVTSNPILKNSCNDLIQQLKNKEQQ